MKAIEDLDVFKKAHDVTLSIYGITSQYPKEETYGLVSQMRRAALSINSNLIEGGARNTSGELKQFIGIARGSAAELKYQIMLSKDLKLVEATKAKLLEEEIENIRKMLTGLIKSIK